MTTLPDETVFWSWHSVALIGFLIFIILLGYFCWRVINALTTRHSKYSENPKTNDLPTVSMNLQGNQNDLAADVGKRQAYQLGLFAEYHKEGLQQSKVTFICSLVFASLGFLVIIWSVAYLVSTDAPQIKLLNSQLTQAKLYRDKAKEEYRTQLEQQTKTMTEQFAKIEEARKWSARRTGREDALRRDYSDLAAATTETVDELPAWVGWNVRGYTLPYNARPGDVLQSLRSSVRRSLLKVYIASLPIFTNTSSIQENVLTLIQGSQPQNESMTNIWAALRIMSDSETYPMLRKFMELIIRVQLGEEETGHALQELESVATTTGISSEKYSTMAKQLAELDDDLSKFRRALEIYNAAKFSPTILLEQDARDSSNRLERAAIIAKFKQLYDQNATNEAAFISYYNTPEQATNLTLVEAKEALLRAETAVETLSGQIKDVGDAKNSTGKNGTNQPLGILGVIAGTIIDAVAALFFVQSNRAKELMTEFFDKLRSDRKLDEAIRLADSIPNADQKSSLLRELCLLLVANDYSKPSKSSEKEKQPKEQNDPRPS